MHLKPAFEKAPENHPDKALVPQAISLIRDVLSKVNREVGKSDNKLKLTFLNSKIFSTEEIEVEVRNNHRYLQQDLQLMQEGRVLLREGKLMLKKVTIEYEVNVFLFDHLLLLTRIKENGFKIVRKVYLTFKCIAYPP